MIVNEEQQKLIDELHRLRPDLIVVPRKASAIMALRGTQHGPVFECFDDGQAVDYTNEFMDFKDVPKNPDWDPDYRDYLREDRRQYVLAAAIWDGCILGFEEWQSYRSRVGSTHMVESWDRPLAGINLVVHPLPESLKKKEKEKSDE